jgi:Sulfotransferase family
MKAKPAAAGYCSLAVAVASVGVADLAPIVIGATGGSGTRVVARIARLAGYDLGTNLNSAEDALEFYPFHDKWINPFVKAQRHRAALSPADSQRMSLEFQAALDRHHPPGSLETHWGWKAPRSIYLLPFLLAELPQMKFIHVLRDGRDMALSANQVQLRKHGAAVLTSTERLFRSAPERSLLLWSRVNARAAEFGESKLRDNYLRVRFEDLCAKPLETTAHIINFLSARVDPEPIAKAEISPPSTLQRWKTCWPALLAKLERLGGDALRKFGYLA